MLAHGTEEELPPIGIVELRPGENIRGAECGGGGYGNPRGRDPERVLHDVLEGWVCVEQARDVYGVALTGRVADETLKLDGENASRLRG